MSIPTPEPFEDFNPLPDDVFRLVVRRWFEESYPPEICNPPKRLHFAQSENWYRNWRSRAGWRRLGRASMAAWACRRQSSSS